MKVKLNRNLGLLLVSIWLILSALTFLTGIGFGRGQIVIWIVGIAAGVVVLFFDKASV